MIGAPPALPAAPGRPAPPAAISAAAVVGAPAAEGFSSLLSGQRAALALAPTTDPGAPVTPGPALNARDGAASQRGSAPPLTATATTTIPTPAAATAIPAATPTALPVTVATGQGAAAAATARLPAESAAESAADPPPVRARGAAPCRAPTASLLRAAEPLGSAAGEAPAAFPPAEPPAATVEPDSPPEALPPVDPAAGLLAQFSLPTALPPPPAITRFPLPAEAGGAAAGALCAVDAAAGLPPPPGEGKLADEVRPALAADAGLSSATLGPALSTENPLSSEWTPATAPVGTAGAALRVELLSLPPPPVNTSRADWPEQLSSQISWQLGQEVQEARIALAPDDLGAIDLQVRVQDGRVQVHMGAAQPATRELLSEALPRLRELLGDCGLNLSQASVFSQDPQSRGRPAWPQAHRPGGAEQLPEATAAVATPRSRGLLDHYA